MISAWLGVILILFLGTQGVRGLSPCSGTISGRTCYEILEIEEDATAKDIQKAYRKMALKLHPDKNPAEKKEECEVKFVELSNAYDVLSNEDVKRKYDAGVTDEEIRARYSGFEDADVFYRGGVQDTPGNWFGMLLVCAIGILPVMAPPMLKITARPRRKLRKWIVRRFEKPEEAAERIERKREKREKKEVELTQYEEYVPEGREEEQRKQEEFRQMEQKKRDVAYERSQTRAIHMKEKKAEKGSDWTEEEYARLAKALVKFPGGTPQRWDKVTDFVATRTVEEVIAKGSRKAKVDDAQKEAFNQKAFDRLQKNVREDREKKEIPASQRNSEGEAIWTAADQKLLEHALMKVDRKSDNAWEKIAELVPGKTKKDCVRRFKHLAAQIKASKAK